MRKQVSKIKTTRNTSTDVLFFWQMFIPDMSFSLTDGFLIDRCFSHWQMFISDRLFSLTDVLLTDVFSNRCFSCWQMAELRKLSEPKLSYPYSFLNAFSDGREKKPAFVWKDVWLVVWTNVWTNWRLILTSQNRTLLEALRTILIVSILKEYRKQLLLRCFIKNMTLVTIVVGSVNF